VSQEQDIVRGITVENAAGLAAQWFAANRTPYPADRFAGRGIITCAGGKRYTVPAYVMVRMLRLAGCTLPVELWYRGPGEYMPGFVRLMEPLGVTWVDAYAVRERYPHARLNGFELKPFAVTHSRFAEVVFLDADNVPLCDPAFLFDDPHYTDAGTIYWPDYHRISKADSLWQVYGVPYRDTYRPETGQIVIDKRLAWDALTLADYYSQRSVFYFRYGYGDLGTFQFSWLVTNTAYAMVPHGVKTLYHSGKHRTMCQHDFHGRRIFQHHNTRKWTIEGWEDIQGFDRLDAVKTILDELRAVVDPTTGDVMDAVTIAELSRQAGRYRYRRLTSDGSGVRDERAMDLHPGGRIGDGTARCETSWQIRGGRLVLIDAAGAVTAEMDRTPSGWAGRWLRYERMPCELLRE
jgi:hypothetical protein